MIPVFEIRIGTILPAEHAENAVPILAPLGFEGYELTCGDYFRTHDIADYAKKYFDLPGAKPVSALGCYDNTLADPNTIEEIERLIDHAHLFQCKTISVFAGIVPGETVEGSIPRFREVFSALCKRAADHGVEIAIENCPMGTTWQGGGMNIGYCPDAWEMLFDAVPDDCLGLEWEPCHALMQLMDPIAQLRKWIGKVKHVHGKDGTVAWDLIREHGIISGTDYAWNRTPGFGDTNWNDVCTILLQNGFRGFIDIEGYHDPVHFDDGEWSAQKRSLDYLKDCRGGRDWIEGPLYKGYQTPKALRKPGMKY